VQGGSRCRAGGCAGWDGGEMETYLSELDHSVRAEAHIKGGQGLAGLRRNQRGARRPQTQTWKEDVGHFLSMKRNMM